MPAYLIIVPLALIASFSFFWVDEELYPQLKVWGVAAPLMLGAGLFMIRDLINEKWLERFPRRVSESTRELFLRFLPYYAGLDEPAKIRFEQRFTNFFVQKDFQVHGPDEVPGDLRALISATAVQVTMGLDDYIYPELGVVVLFQNPFITPDLPTVPHALELKREDHDTAILSMDGFAKGLTRPGEYYHIGLHLFAKALQWHLGISDQDVPRGDCASEADFVRALEELRGFREGYLSTLTGLGDPEIFPRCTEHFFMVPHKLRERFPAVYDYLCDILHQNPLSERFWEKKTGDAEVG
jgi:Mlc titration factor MtfA (ptsG expression regulator)